MSANMEEGLVGSLSSGATLAALWLLLGLLAGTALEFVIRWLIVQRDPDGTRCACDSFRFDLRLVPLWGALSRGRCARCSKRTAARALGLQLSVAVVFAALAWRFALDYRLVVYSAYALILALVFVVDLEHRLIFDSVTYPGMVLSLLAAGFLGLLSGSSFLGGLQTSFFGGLFAGGLFLGFYLLAIVVYRGHDALGMGDVKLALLIGLMVGWPNAVAAILLGTLVGAALGVFLMAWRRSGKATMPYGTALTLGAIIGILWLQPVP